MAKKTISWPLAPEHAITVDVMWRIRVGRRSQPEQDGWGSRSSGTNGTCATNKAIDRHVTGMTFIRHLLLFTMALNGPASFAQSGDKLLVLPDLDSTQLITTVARPGKGYLLLTRQVGTVDAGATLIATDQDGEPVSALHSLETIVNLITCSDSGFLAFSGDRTLLKMDSTLNVEWATTLQAPPLTWAAGELAESNGAYYLAGIVKSQLIDTFQLNYGTYAAALFKFDGSGQLTDQVIIADTSHTSFQYNLYQPEVVAGGDGSVYMSLNMLPDAMAGTCNRQPAVVKFNAGLDVQWSSRYLPSTYNGLKGMCLLPTGDLLLYGNHGYTSGVCTNFRNYIGVLDTAGAVLFARSYRHADPLSHTNGNPVVWDDGSVLFPEVHSTPFPFVNTRYFHHVDAQGNTIASQLFTLPSGYNFTTRSARGENGITGVFRMNAPDTLFFAPIDATLTTQCYSLPDAVIDSTITLVPLVFTPHYLEHNFVFVDTAYTFTPAMAVALPACDFSTGVNTQHADEVLVFPNPSTGDVRVQSEEIIQELVVLDALGRIVLRSAPRTTAASVRIASAGVYTVHVNTGTSEHVSKLVVEGH